MKPKFTLAALLVCQLLNADAVVHKFELWGSTEKKTDKLLLYWGWTNGFLQARGARGLGLAQCLEGITPQQAIAMVDKHYKFSPSL